MNQTDPTRPDMNLPEPMRELLRHYHSDPPLLIPHSLDHLPGRPEWLLFSHVVFHLVEAVQYLYERLEERGTTPTG